MRIYAMTAVFGKLDADTLELKPGLNVIEAHNEWGKSTWCAFLLAMLYGIDTRSKTTKNTLPDKTRYAPWSGKPMSGRIDLCWNGRDITIERTTAGRIPLGNFRAYETDTGLDIPGLDSYNCGEKLLGVPKSVFARTGFIRFSDLPFTEEEALRSRLNALVTTGDDSGDGAKLEKGLQELKKKLSSRTGLLSQAEQRRSELENTLQQMEALQKQQKTVRQAIADAKETQQLLLRHQSAQTAQQLAAARLELEAAEAASEQLSQQCACLPSRDAARQRCQEITHLLEQKAQVEAMPIPPMPEPPEVPPCFRGLTPQKAAAQVEEDTKIQNRKPKLPPAMLLACLALAVLGFALLGANQPMYAGMILTLAAGLIGFCLLRMQKPRTDAALEARYGSADPAQWQQLLQQYTSQDRIYQSQLAEHRNMQNAAQQRMATLRRLQKLQCGEHLPHEILEQNQQAIRQWDALEAAQLRLNTARQQYAALRSLTGDESTGAPDECTLSPEETRQQLEQTEAQLQKLQRQSGNLAGQLQRLGEEQQLRQALTGCIQRLTQLQDMEAAVTISLATLEAARRKLQHRFAPLISRKAQGFLSRLTGNRYTALQLDSDFTIRTAQAQEITQREARWLSDGTVDQVYLALRLACAQVLTPDAPIVLDDALVRFDDTRLKAAMELLAELAEETQVILFTCQGREGLWA